MTEQLHTDGSSSAEKAELLARFVGEAHSSETTMAEYWRTASSEEHAKAMCELSMYAEQMSQQTGFTKDVTEQFPGFPAKK
ncbi:hypothetical protein H7Y63_00970 [Polaromonas sp.]|nr:hypothetical protein [Candidatus Saccharibacteria bacterium]